MILEGIYTEQPSQNPQPESPEFGCNFQNESLPEANSTQKFQVDKNSAKTPNPKPKNACTNKFDVFGNLQEFDELGDAYTEFYEDGDKLNQIDGSFSEDENDYQNQPEDKENIPPEEFYTENTYDDYYGHQKLKKLKFGDRKVLQEIKQAPEKPMWLFNFQTPTNFLTKNSLINQDNNSTTATKLMGPNGKSGVINLMR